MVRLMLTLTPVVCVLAAIAFSKTFEIYLKDDAPKSSGKETSEEPAESKNDRLYDKVRGRGRNSSIWWHVLWNFLKLTIKSLLKYNQYNLSLFTCTMICLYLTGLFFVRRCMLECVTFDKPFWCLFYLMKGWQNQENKRGETQRPGCHGNEHQDNCDHSPADDPDAVCCTLYLGH